MYIYYIQPVSCAVASNIGQPLFFFCTIIPPLTSLTVYHFSCNLPKCTQNKYIYIFFFVLAPSQSRPYDNVTTIIPHLWHPCPVTVSPLHSFDE